MCVCVYIYEYELFFCKPKTNKTLQIKKKANTQQILSVTPPIILKSKT